MISEPRNAAGVPGLHFYGRFCTIFPSISWATCHRQLSCTAKFLLFRHKRGTNAFFVHNFVIPYLYKHITQTEILLWNTTIGTRAGCSPPHSTRRWCARSARSFPLPRCGCRTRSSPCLITTAMRTTTSACAATGGSFLRPKSGWAAPCCLPSGQWHTMPLCSATGGGCSIMAAATPPLRWI